MGLDLHELTLPQRARPAYQAGIRHLLQDRQVREHSALHPEPQVQVQSVRQEEHPEPELPAPWSVVRPRLRPPHATVWTYWQLGEDLGATPSARRRDLFNAILTKLGWPRGSVVFWPLSSFDGHTHTPRSDLFWYGVRTARAQTVVIFGVQAFIAVLPEHNPCFGITTTAQGVQVVHVPGPDDMLPDNRKMKNMAWNMLCSLSFS